MTRAIVLIEDNISLLTTTLNLYLKDGYSPSGGITLTKQDQYMVLVLKEY